MLNWKFLDLQAVWTKCIAYMIIVTFPHANWYMLYPLFVFFFFYLYIISIFLCFLESLLSWIYKKYYELLFSWNFLDVYLLLIFLLGKYILTISLLQNIEICSKFVIFMFECNKFLIISHLLMARYHSPPPFLAEIFYLVSCLHLLI